MDDDDGLLTTAETRARWKAEVEADPYKMVRSSVVKVLLSDLEQVLAKLEKAKSDGP